MIRTRTTCRPIALAVRKRRQALMIRTRTTAVPVHARLAVQTRTRRMMTTRRVCQPRPMTRLRRTFAQRCCFNRTWLRQRSRCPWRLGNVHSTLMIGHHNTVRVVLPMSLPSTRAPYQRSVGWAAWRMLTQHCFLTVVGASTNAGRST